MGCCEHNEKMFLLDMAYRLQLLPFLEKCVLVGMATWDSSTESSFSSSVEWVPCPLDVLP
jgi:hypothetical protein